MRYIYFLSLAVTVLFGASGCSGEKEAIPAYLRIDSVQFTGTGPLQGTNYQDITEAWVFLDDDLQGVYDVPCEVPILALGKHQIKVRGGIKRNGMLNSRVDYPFFSTYQTDVNFEAVKTVKIDPVLHYFNDVLVWEENFEDAGVKLLTNGNSDTSLILTNTPGEVFEGNGSGKVSMSKNRFLCRFASNQNFKFPTGEPIFIEIHYKTNDVLTAGLVTHQTGGSDIYTPVAYIGDSPNKWSKIYINLSEAVNSSSFASGFDIYFQSNRVSNGITNSPENISILIDNVKVVYPKR